MAIIPSVPTTPKLLDQVRHALRLGHYSRRTEESYVGWIRRFILFHHKRHPAEMGGAEVVAFLTHLPVTDHVSASTQNQALHSVLFLYRQVPRRDLGELGPITRARMPERVPVVLSRDEVRLILGRLDGTTWLIVALLYGAGLRLTECLELRVKDIDFAKNQVVVRRGKGAKDRTPPLPAIVKSRLSGQLDAVRRMHEADLAAGYGRVVLPDPIAHKYPNAAAEWPWQFVFPAARICRDPKWGGPTRFHLHESAVQRAVAEAARRADINKLVGCHTFRHHADRRIMPMNDAR